MVFLLALSTDVYYHLPEASPIGGAKVGQKNKGSARMGKITAKRLEALSDKNDGDVLREDGGLVGKVRVGKRGITVLFRYEFKLDGRKHDHRLGSWPKRSLAEIRAERDTLRVSVSKGLDPAKARRAEKVEAKAAIEATLAKEKEETKENLTISDLFEEWLRDGVARQDGNAELRRSFNKDVLSAIGNKPLRELTHQDILAVLRKVRERGVNRLAVILNNDIGQMLRWGEKRQPWRSLMVEGNPADLVDIEKLLDMDYEEERDRTLSDEEIIELAHRFQQLENDYQNQPAGKKYEVSQPVIKEAQLAIWICLSTLCRIGELLSAEWSHVDLDKQYWLIPASNTKGRRGKKQDHHVFLSDFASQQFKKLKAMTGGGRWCFPAKNKEDSHVCPKSISKQVGDRQIMFKDRKVLKGRRNDNSLVLANGKNGAWTPHDLRRTGATIMQKLGVSLDVIDRCQNHVLAGSKVRRHYLKHEYIDEKTSAWGRLGDYLDSLDWQVAKE
ncbi:tyrosine-type recombinase/integrase [Marinospirillum sp.]|uniref:tyrosine-type recombinase/integrase n=1 Tax=Marinospirillum sp. TaxID=2183934 RepID=UPI00384E4B20